MPRMIEVEIDSVRVSLTNQQRIVILRQKNDDRYLPIWIGAYEAEAITVALQEIEVARPQTHDLLKNMINALSGRLVRVEVLSLREEVYYGNLVVEVNGQMVNVDSRPSDALALAVRMHTPIFVSAEVMEAAGISPEEDIENQPQAAKADLDEAPQTEEPGSQDRLSVFEDFLQNIDFDSSEDQTDGEDDQPDQDDPDKQK